MFSLLGKGRPLTGASLFPCVEFMQGAGRAAGPAAQPPTQAVPACPREAGAACGPILRLAEISEGSVGFAPGFSYLGIHQKRNRQRDCGFHLLAHQLPHLLGGSLRGLNNEFIVNLQNKAGGGDFRL